MRDYPPEATRSIPKNKKPRDPASGYAKDFVPQMERILPLLVERRVKVTANAGGVNPRACAQAVAAAARQLGLGGKLRIGVVTGDDLLPRLDGLLARGHDLKRSEEHTSELQSRLHLVCRLLLEKKKKKTRETCTQM